MSYTPKPTFIVSFRGKNGSMGFVRTDDVDETKKVIALEGHKVVDTVLDKRVSFDDLLTKAGSMDNDVALYAQEQLRARETLRVEKLAGDPVKHVDDPFWQDQAALAVYKKTTGSANHPINQLRDETVEPASLQAQEDARKAAEGDVLHIHLPLKDDADDDADAKDDDDNQDKEDAGDAAEDFATNYARAYAESKARERAEARARSKSR